MDVNNLMDFSIARLPKIEFGCGRFLKVASIAHGFGQRVLLVTGASSFSQTANWELLLRQFDELGINFTHVTIDGEPSPDRVDDIVAGHRGRDFDVVLAIGGGSALDAGKAIAGLLNIGDSVMDYLEGVGPEKTYQGPAVPFIAVPTTAGTGSEATKNAVLSRHGAHGFKKSFRDEQLVADIAVIDPDLLASCPQSVIAANGMDALTQLMESYVSLKTNEFNNALGLRGLAAARDGLLRLYDSKGQDSQARENMAYASFISGINLAQTGLGSVHGLASPLGAFYPVPHGVVCGTLVAAATKINTEAMLAREPDNIALNGYKKVAEILLHRHYRQQDEALQDLVMLLETWTEKMQIQKLSHYGLQEEEFDRVIAHARGSSMKTNPIVLSDDELHKILKARL